MIDAKLIGELRAEVKWLREGLERIADMSSPDEESEFQQGLSYAAGFAKGMLKR